MPSCDSQHVDAEPSTIALTDIMTSADDPNDWSSDQRFKTPNDSPDENENRSRPLKRKYQGNPEKGYAQQPRENSGGPYSHERFGRGFQVPDDSDSDTSESLPEPQMPEEVETTERPSKIPKIHASQRTLTARHGIIIAPLVTATICGKACLAGVSYYGKEYFKNCASWVPSAACAVRGIAMNPRSVFNDIVGEVRKNPRNTVTSCEATDRLFVDDPRNSEDQINEPKPEPTSGAVSSAKPSDPLGTPPSLRPRPTPDTLPDWLIPGRLPYYAVSPQNINAPLKGGGSEPFRTGHMPSPRPPIPVSKSLDAPSPPQASLPAQAPAASGNIVTPAQTPQVPRPNIKPLAAENAADVVAEGFFKGLGRFTTPLPSKGLSQNEKLFGKAATHTSAPPSPTIHSETKDSKYTLASNKQKVSRPSMYGSRPRKGLFKPSTINTSANSRSPIPSGKKDLDLQPAFTRAIISRPSMFRSRSENELFQSSTTDTSANSSPATFEGKDLDDQSTFTTPEVSRPSMYGSRTRKGLFHSPSTDTSASSSTPIPSESEMTDIDFQSASTTPALSRPSMYGSRTRKRLFKSSPPNSTTPLATKDFSSRMRSDNTLTKSDTKDTLPQPIKPPSPGASQRPSTKTSTSQGNPPAPSADTPKVPPRKYFPRAQAPENYRKSVLQRALQNAKRDHQEAQARRDRVKVMIERGSSMVQKHPGRLETRNTKARAEREKKKRVTRAANMAAEAAAKAAADATARNELEEELIAAAATEQLLQEMEDARIRDAEEEKLRMARSVQSNLNLQSSQPGPSRQQGSSQQAPSRSGQSREPILPTGRVCQHCTMRNISIHREYCEYCSLPFPLPPAPRSHANGVIQIDRSPDTLVTWPYPDPRDREFRELVTYRTRHGPVDTLHDPLMMTGGAGDAGTLDSNGDHEPLSPSTLQRLRDEREERLASQTDRERWRREAGIIAQEQQLNEPATQPYYGELTPEELEADRTKIAHWNSERDSRLARQRWAGRQGRRAEEARVRQAEREATRALQYMLRPERTEVERLEWMETLFEGYLKARENGMRLTRDAIMGSQDLSKEDVATLRKDLRSVRQLSAARTAAALRLLYNSKGEWIGPEEDEQNDQGQEQDDINVSISAQDGPFSHMSRL
ncbi:hypothetical protein J1614_003607 [Plenodomus biglobosus]|nr:hypothetical protein J1614_003607 [Plenodomus biglobosus]